MSKIQVLFSLKCIKNAECAQAYYDNLLFKAFFSMQILIYVAWLV